MTEKDESLEPEYQLGRMVSLTEDIMELLDDLADEEGGVHVPMVMGALRYVHRKTSQQLMKKDKLGRKLAEAIADNLEIFFDVCEGDKKKYVAHINRLCEAGSN